MQRLGEVVLLRHLRLEVPLPVALDDLPGLLRLGADLVRPVGRVVLGFKGLVGDPELEAV